MGGPDAVIVVDRRSWTPESRTSSRRECALLPADPCDSAIVRRFGSCLSRSADARLIIPDMAGDVVVADGLGGVQSVADPDERRAGSRWRSAAWTASAASDGGGTGPRPWSARLGAHPMGLWIIKHLISPLDRFLVRVSRGRLAPLSSLAVPTLLLTVVGRRSGAPRTVPLVFVRDGERYVVGNARPAGERRNPWIVNLRAAGRGRILLDGRTITVEAHELDGPEAERWWPALVKVWPAFAAEYAATNERTLFALQPQA